MLELRDFVSNYAPTNLEDCVDGKHTRKAVDEIFKVCLVPQPMLIQGVSSCGKTTTARLIAKEYLYDNKDKLDLCAVLNEYIQTGDTTNLDSIKEVDAESLVSKKDLDTLVEDMMTGSSERRVYIFDEFHMVATESQDRLAEIVGNLPENVLAIFCTDDTKGISENFKSKCKIHLEVAKPTVYDLIGVSEYICKMENIEYDLEGLELIASKVNSNIRYNLNLLYQVINEQGNATYKSASGVLDKE